MPAKLRQPYDPTAPRLDMMPAGAGGRQPSYGEGTYTPPGGNTGVSGGIDPSNRPPVGPVEEPPTQNPPGQPPGQPPAQPAAHAAGHLYGTLDPSKLQNPDGSAKYEFLQEAQNMDSYDPAELLRRLQAKNPTYWNGWAAHGDKINYTGNDLNPVFDGLREFDVLHDQEHNGGWGWQDTTSPLGANPGQGGQGGGQAPANPVLTGAGPGGVTSNPVDLNAILQGLISNGGGFNQGIVDRRTEAAATALRREANSRKENNRSILASRGLIGSGPEGSMYGRVDTDTADRFANQVSGIYADESENADSRMIQALQMAGALSTADADRMLNYFRANNDYTLGSRGLDNQFTLGQGNIALGNFQAQNDYNLGLGNFGLDRERLAADIDANDTDSMIQLLQLLLGGANTSAGGHV